MTNKAADRLRNLESDDYQSDITEALAAERRATVEFIEAEYQRSTISEHGTVVIPDIAKVLAKALER